MNKQEFSLLQQNIEKEEPYLLQEDFEEQLKERFNEYIYYEGGTSYEAPLQVYEGEILDYIVLHQKQWDSQEAGYKKYSIFVLLQPRDEKLSTSMVDLTVYNDSMYSFSLHGRLNRKIDFEDSGAVQAGLMDLLGTSIESDKVKMWYVGTLHVGKGEEPQYPDFEEKEDFVAKVYDWTETYLAMSGITENVDIFVREFREEDSQTEVLIEIKDGEVKHLILPYYFYQENNFQKPLEVKEEEYSTYVEKLKKMSVK